jgi:hypothetical protein
MLTTTVNLPTRRAPSPQIRARDTSLDGTTNGSAGINSAPNVDAGINGATHLGEQYCGDHEDHGDSTDYRKLAEHKIGPQQGRLPPPWRRRTNLWRRITSPARGCGDQQATGSAAQFLWRCQLAESPLRGLSAAGLSLPYAIGGRKPSAVEPRRSPVKAVNPPSPQTYLNKTRPLDGLLRDRPRPTEETHVMEEIDVSSRKRASKRPSDSVGFARASRTSRRRSKQAACVTISESSGERGPRRAEIERASGYAGSHPARFNGSNSAHIRAFRVPPALSRSPGTSKYR